MKQKKGHIKKNATWVFSPSQNTIKPITFVSLNKASHLAGGKKVLILENMHCL